MSEQSTKTTRQKWGNPALNHLLQQKSRVSHQRKHQLFSFHFTPGDRATDKGVPLLLGLRSGMQGATRWARSEVSHSGEKCLQGSSPHSLKGELSRGGSLQRALSRPQWRDQESRDHSQKCKHANDRDCNSFETWAHQLGPKPSAARTTSPWGWSWKAFVTDFSGAWKITPTLLTWSWTPHTSIYLPYWILTSRRHQPWLIFPSPYTVGA